MVTTITDGGFHRIPDSESADHAQQFVAG